MIRKEKFFYVLCLIVCVFIIYGLTSCSAKEDEDRIVYDLNEIFDPEHKGDTDWNYTEIDQEWMDNAGL